MKYKIKHINPPVLAVIKDKKYLMPGWTEVPMETTLDDVEYEKVVLITDKIEHKVTGSRGDVYTVTEYNNTLKCDCPAGKFNRKCKHLKQI